MFDDLDASLKTLLGDPAAPTSVRAATIDFATPDRDYKPNESTLNLFLHDVTENRTLREPTRWVVGDETTVSSSPPVLRVDCTYLVTSWSTQAGGVKIAEEHRLLAQALTWLARFPVVDDSMLTGALTNPPQPYPVGTAVARTQEGQQMAHFWSALGISPRPAFSLTATLTLQPFDEDMTDPAVQDVHVQSGSLLHPRLTGRVLNADLRPVSRAVVSVDGADPATTTAGGDFIFIGIEFGLHTLRAEVPGLGVVERSISFSRHDQIHNLIVSGP